MPVRNKLGYSIAINIYIKERDSLAIESHAMEIVEEPDVCRQSRVFNSHSFLPSAEYKYRRGETTEQFLR